MQLHHLQGYIQSIYLAEYPDKLMLLDGCSRADTGKVLRFIKNQLNRPISDLKTVVVTHMHPDHAGAANRLRQITGCKIVAADVEGQWYQGFDGKLMHLTDLMLANWVAGRMKKPRKFIWYSPSLEADIYLEDGEAIPGFEDWQVLYTQGHTDRDISLYHQETGKLYVADLMVAVKGRYIPPYPVFYPNRYRRSVARVEALRPQNILLAHGGEVSLGKDDYQHLLQKAPKVPMTHWRSVKSKLSQSLGLGKTA